MKCITGVIYHPPDNDIDSFMISFDAILSKLSQSKTNCLIARDYDIDLLKSEVHSDTEQFLNNLYIHLFIPSILKPTRFGSSSFYQIDNNFTDKPHDI